MKPDDNYKALRETEGVSQPNSTNKGAARNLKRKRKDKYSALALFNDIRDQKISALSRAITLIESSNNKHQELASQIITLCLPYSGNSIRIGVTGVPGVGKSTFIEALGSHFSTQNKRIAILAVDPSSHSSKGSILGDKTRMETLVRRENVFIRPTPSGTSLGGVARKTRETIILCEAAGFDTIIIETVGVGQSEIAVHSMVDFFLLLKLAGAGDELQGIKRGIIEMADLIAINKADGENLKAARMAQQDFNNALHLYPAKASGWKPKVLLCSALENEGISKISDELDSFIMHVKSNNSFTVNRINQQQFWLKHTIEERLKSDFYENKKMQTEFNRQLELIKNQKTTAFAAANYLLNL